MNRYRHTDYPNIYKYSYWGGSSQPIDKVTLANRNQFISDYHIVKGIKTKPQYLYSYLEHLKKSYRQMFDHLEVYESIDGTFVIIASPYGDRSYDINEYGFTRIYNLYENHGSSTYMQSISKSQIMYINRCNKLKKGSSLFG